ncbi:TetR/AcrR family transcriptional regulator [Streptomyces sp. RGM 3693]|uniref:TetR/AcrR family transcriptional regulator n=1 Tax=Streptomyces sp. RGM 3693 TaxID=3413284 RepID=UPI003D292F32
MAVKSARTERAAQTREVIMAAAVRLFAEHGLAEVSSRQISEAAGQGNNTAVGYHFGTRNDLVRAIIRKHAEATERIRQRMLGEIGESNDVRGWVSCLVRPTSEHLATLGSPSWYARFAVQVMSDPVLRVIIEDEALTRAPLRQTLDGLGRCLPELPAHARAERAAMMRHLIMHTYAERERALAAGTTPLQPAWEDTALALTDAIVGLLLAPVTPRPDRP